MAQASDDDVYAAMDWLGGRQDAIEAELARRHLAPEVNPSRMALFDLSSSWLEGTRCPLAARDWSRDGKKAKLQIEYGLLTDPEGRPVAVRVLPGNTGDPTAFTSIVQMVRDKFKLARMVMVGDRGMITSARIDALKEMDENERFGWITALRGPRYQQADGRRGAAAAVPVRRAGSRRDHLAGLPPASGWPPAATWSWPPIAPASARTCWPPPNGCSALSPAGWRPGGCAARTRSAWPWQGDPQAQDGQAPRRHHHR